MEIKKSSIITDINLKLHSFRGIGYIEDFMNRCKNSDKPVMVYFDPDVDGLVSGYFACKFLAMLGIPFIWYINPKRAHGFLIPSEKVRGMNIFCVDFLIPDAQMKELVCDYDCNILSMDHHENGEKYIEYDFNDKKGVVINNQYPFEEESSRYLSGAGVVFECAVASLGEAFDTKENRALVGLTLLTDIRNIENINARLYLQDLYTHKYKGYIGYLIDGTIGNVDYGFGVPRLDRNYVDYIFSPIVNSMLRFGQQDRVVEFFLGRGTLDRRYHDMQKKLVEVLVNDSVVTDYENLRAIAIDYSRFIGTEYESYLSSFVGLVASRHLDGKKSAICYLEYNGKIIRGSFRGRVNGLDYLSNFKGIINGVGHGPAFGIKDDSLTDETFRKLSDICKELEGNTNFDPKIVNTSNLSMLVNTRGYKLGVDNIYCLSQNRVYVKYTGSEENVKKKRCGAKYTEYAVNGISVKCFDSSLHPCHDYIMPVIERGVLYFYLNKSCSEDMD